MPFLLFFREGVMFCLFITSTYLLNTWLSRKHSLEVSRNLVIWKNIIWNEIMHKEHGARQICLHLLLCLIFSSLQPIIWSAQCLKNSRQSINDDSLLFLSLASKLEQGKYLDWNDFVFFMAYLQFWRKGVLQVTHIFRFTYLFQCKQDSS